MPLIEEAAGSSAGRQPAAIATSIPVEIFWAAHAIVTGRHHQDVEVLMQPHRALRERLRTFWAPGGPDCLGEMLIIAGERGMLFTSSIAELTQALREPTTVDPELRLASETPEDRQALLERCSRLAADRRLRERYAVLVTEVWSLVADEWEVRGRDVAEAAAGHLRRTAQRAASLDELLPSGHHLHDPWFGQAAAAFSEGRLSIASSYFGGKFMAWDLDDTYLIGLQAAPQDRMTVLRRDAHRAATRLKVLADPTRLAILVYLARSPTTVTDLARIFDLAQPTVSAHLKQLREAGLVDGGREDGRTDYAADVRSVTTLLKEVEHIFELKR